MVELGGIQTLIAMATSDNETIMVSTFTHLGAKYKLFSCNKT